MRQAGNTDQEVITMPAITTAPARTLAWEDEVYAAEAAAYAADEDFGQDPERFLSEHDLVPAMTVDLDEVEDLNALAEAQSEAAWEYLAGMDHYPW